MKQRYNRFGRTPIRSGTGGLHCSSSDGRILKTRIEEDESIVLCLMVSSRRPFDLVPFCVIMFETSLEL
jgi:hypothetical protein